MAAIKIETSIDRINRIAWFFILSILFIDVRQESKGGHGWQMRVAERERLQAGGYPSENRTRLRPGAPDYPSALGHFLESVTMEGGQRAMTTITDPDTQ